MKEVSMWTFSENKEWAFLEQQYSWVGDMAETPQDPVHHAEGNVAVHTQMVLAALQTLPEYAKLDAQAREILWTAALLHDVEKRSTTVTDDQGRVSSPGHAKKGAQTARLILYRDLATPFAIREQVVGLVRYHGLPLWLLERQDALKTLIRSAFEVNTQWLSLLARADVLGRICDDQEEWLYRIDCFEEFCKEHHCWGTERPFANPVAKMRFLHTADAPVDYVPYDSPVFEVVLMSGLPGAGKDSFIRKHFVDLPVISLDGIREEWKVAADDKTANGRVIQEAKERAKVLLRRKQGFVWNATNITVQMREQLIDLFLTYRAAVRIVYLEVPYLVLTAQNKNREAVVPQKVLERLINKLEVPAGWEAHTVSWINFRELM
jgi:putative nucleotidyltransferase with HDIG domain